MTIAQEMRLKEELTSARHEALLGVLRTAQVLGAEADRFFGPFGLTGTQFNILIILRDWPEGLRQVELSERQLVNRSNITGLVDRLERAGLVRRADDPTDRRAHMVRLTDEGRRRVESVEERYHARVVEVMGALSDRDARKLAALLEKVRGALRTDG